MSRKRKSEGVPPANQGEVLPPARHVMPLRTPMDCTREKKRLYRLAMNGKISTEEMAKFTYVITSIRTDLEADAPLQIDQAPGGYVVDTVVINGVPSGEMLSAEEISRLESQFAEVPPAHIAGPPMLRLYDNVDDTEEPPPAA